MASVRVLKQYVCNCDRRMLSFTLSLKLDRMDGTAGIFTIKERTKVNYKPLWKILIDRDMSKTQFRKEASISRSTVFKMVNNQYVAMDVLVRICMAPGCGMDDLVEIERY